MFCLKFRFHTGSIKSSVSAMKEVAQELFRFHTGSIKSYKTAETVEKHNYMFRFHTGSIKSQESRSF